MIPEPYILSAWPPSVTVSKSADDQHWCPQVSQLQTELVSSCAQSSEALQGLEQAVTDLARDRAAAEEAADGAKRGEAAVRVELQRLQGELETLTSEREWAQESMGALQVSRTQVL